MADAPVVLSERWLLSYWLVFVAALAAAALAVGIGTHGGAILLTLASVAALFLAITFLVTFRYGARARRLMRHHDVHWQYDERTWQAYLADYRGKWRRGVWLSVVIGFAVGVFYAAVEHFDDDPVQRLGIVRPVLTTTLIGAGFATVLLATGRATRAAIRQAPREAFIGNGIYIAGAYYATGGRIERTEVEAGDPAWLTVHFRTRSASPSGLPTTTTVTRRIPIPPGQEDVARSIRPDR